MSKLVIVETISQFRIRYVVELDDNDPNYIAAEEVLYTTKNDTPKEFSQIHLGEFDISSREISKDEYLRMFDEDNAYLKDWTESQKLGFINKKEM